MPERSKAHDGFAALKRGEVLGFPTETFYGLAADPRNPSAVQKLLRLKGREIEGGIPLILDRTERLSEIGEDPETTVRALIDRFWPGPLTLVLWPSHEFARDLQPGIAAADGSIAVRVSSHALARELAHAVGGAITSTSANPHREQPPRTKSEVLQYFPDLIVLDDPFGETDRPIQPSTILDVREQPFRIIREGAIREAELRDFLG